MATSSTLSKKRMSASIELKNLPQEADEEYITLFFEDEENCGESIHVKNVFLDTAQSSAVMELNNAEDVDQVIDRQPYEMENASVTAEKFTLSSVEVLGPSEIICEKNKPKMKMHFKNPRRADGGPIQAITIVAPGKAIIKYESEQVARKVADKKKHRFMDTELDVNLYHPKNYKSKTLLIKELPDSVDREFLELYFEEEEIFGKILHAAIVVNTKRRSAFVRFDTFEDVELVLEHLPLEIAEEEVSVKWCSIQDEGNAFINSSIDIQGPLDLINESNTGVLKQYFQKESQSKDDVILTFLSETGKAKLTFESEEVARRVASKTSYVVQNQQVYVKLSEEEGEEKLDDSLHDLPSLPADSGSNKIEVVGLPATVDEDFLELYFDREGESEVLNVTMHPETSSAIIEFENPNAVDIVVGKETFKIKEQTVTVRKYSPEENIPCTIKVTGKGMNAHKLETLYMYFTNTRKSGGGDVKDHYLKDDVAYFTFESNEVMKSVLENKHDKHGVTVELYKAGKPTEDGPHKSLDKKANEVVQSTDLTNTPYVKVKGIQDTIVRQTIELYFENTKRAGGGKVEEIMDDVEDNSIKYIRFQNHDVAKSVADRNHTIDGYKLQVTLYVPPPCDEKKIFVRGIPEQTTKDSLLNFLEAKSNTRPVDISYHADQMDTALVTMEDEPDFAKLEKACSETRLEGAYLRLSKVPISNCIWVGNLTPGVTQETVQLYFESKKGGEGFVEKVTMNASEGTCLVYFEDYKVIDEIIRKEHHLGEKKLSVKKYAICLGCPEGDTREKKMKIPGPIEITTANKYKIKFLKKSEYRLHFEQELLKTHAKVIWPSGDETAIKLECTLTLQDKHVSKLSREWAKCATDIFTQLLESLTDTDISILQDIWDRAKQCLSSISISNPDEVCVFPLQEKGVFKIVGKTDAVGNLRAQVETNISEIIKDLSKVKEEMKTFKPLELQLLQKMKFQENLCSKYPDLNVVIDDQNKIIIIEGNSNSVRDAKVDIYEKTKSFAIVNISDFSITTIQLLDYPEIRVMIDAKIQKMATWMIDAGELVVCCSDRKNHKKCIEIFKETVKEKTLKVNDVDIPDLKTKNWTTYVDGIKRKNQGKVSITLSSDFREIVLCASSDIFDKLIELISQFIKCNTVIIDSIECENDIFELLEKHHQKELNLIKKGHENECIDLSFDKKNECIKLKCLEKELDIAQKKLKDLLQKVVVQQHTINKPGIVDFMKTPKGKENLDAIERVHPCRIAIVGLNEPADSSNVVAICKVKDRRIIASVCDITDQNVQLIMNPSDEFLQLFGGLGKAIVSKGGQSIKDACIKHGKLEDNEVFITDGGNLKAAHVAHFKSDEWKDGNRGEKEQLGKIVMLCLMKANSLDVKSIAIPAIGCGVNRFPVDIATGTIVDALKKFFLEVQDSCIEEIYLCDMDINRVQGFVKGLRRLFGQNNVQNVGGDDRSSASEKIVPVLKSGARNAKRGGSVRSELSPEKEVSKEKPTATKSVKLHPVQHEMKIAIKLEKGELAKQNVDVLVNTTASDLVLSSGAVSRSLLNNAGQGIQDELKTKHPNGLKGAKLAVTGGHNLPCRYVLHAVVAHYDSKSIDKSKQRLREIVTLCLDEASHLNQSTIAFPAIGTGNLGFPHQLVAQQMYAAVREYGKRNPASSLKAVSFVVYPKDVPSVQAFDEVLSRMNTSTENLEDWETVDQTSSSGMFMYGSVGVCVKVGDLLEEEVDCIVHETNDKFDFTQGTISKRLLERGGRVFEEELDATRDDMIDDKIGYTSAPRLPCRNIIHVAMQPGMLPDMVDKCLQLAENLKVKSIAFPAFCTESFQCDHSEVAKDAVKGIKQFMKLKPQHVKEIRFIIISSDTTGLGVYQTAVEKGSDSRASKTFFKGVWQMFGFGGSNTEKSDRNEAEQSAEHTQSGKDSVTFKIYSLSKDEIVKVKQKIDMYTEGEMKTKTFQDPVIERMDAQQEAELQSMIRHHQVDGQIDKDNGKIVITGIKDRVFDVSDKIFTFLKDVTEMNLMVHVVQWYVILVEEEGERVIDYDKDLNIVIERAYQKKEPNLQFWNSDCSENFVIDFDKMEEYPLDRPEDVAKVIRRDKVKSSSGFQPPPTWEAMQGNLRVVKLDKHSSEYSDIEKKFISSSKGYTSAVEGIERIQNVTLWEQYQSKKKEMDEINKGQENERYLWHGTAEKTVDSINVHGFNRSYCGENAVVFGEGVYFAIEANYSCRKLYSKPDSNGIQRVYSCRVLTGDFTLGKEKMRVPPPNPSRGVHCLYNSVVDEMNESKRQMYIIFHDTQAYPEYLIYFKKTATTSP